MSWRAAFLAQAKSDAMLLDRLNVPEVEYSHRLHYLQMISEKLAKGLLHSPSDQHHPEPTHAAFVRMLRTLKGRPEIGRRLGYTDRDSFRSFIDSLLPIAQRVQALAPAIAGFTQPNAEYPWQSAVDNSVISPCHYPFRDFDPRHPQMAKLVQLLRDLTRIAT